MQQYAKGMAPPSQQHVRGTGTAQQRGFFMGAFISSFVMFIGSWGPASDEEGDVGRKHSYYSVLITFYGIIEMVMGSMHVLQVLLFESMLEYGDICSDTIYLIVLNKNI